MKLSAAYFDAESGGQRGSNSFCAWVRGRARFRLESNGAGACVTSTRLCARCPVRRLAPGRALQLSRKMKFGSRREAVPDRVPTDAAERSRLADDIYVNRKVCVGFRNDRVFLPRHLLQSSRVVGGS